MKGAKEISKAIIDTPTELRGELFKDIATELIKVQQGYTAALFNHIAHKYGFKKE